MTCCAKCRKTKDPTEQDADDTAKEGTGDDKKRLTMWGLAFMTFFAVSGGPYGIEDAVSAGYPFLVLLGMRTDSTVPYK
jgi:hypothetical protein